MSDVIPTVRKYILDKYLPGEDESNLTPDTELVRSGILDSLATLDLVAFLESRYQIEFEAHEVEPTKLATLSEIDLLVRQKLQGPA